MEKRAKIYSLPPSKNFAKKIPLFLDIKISYPNIQKYSK